MPEYRNATERLEVPKNTGVDGFLLTIRKILSLPRIQSILINGNGKITFERAVRVDEDVNPLDIDYESIAPAGIIRNGELVELPAEQMAPMAMARMFAQVASENLFPVALVSGPGSVFWLWHELSKLTMSPSKDQAYGVPFLYDEYIPSEALVLCTSYTRSTSMSEVRKSFKMMMPANLLRNL